MSHKKQTLTELAIACAKQAGLRYVLDGEQGICRIRKGSTKFTYELNGKAIHDKKILKRIAGLAVPPAWMDVWICTDPKGHLQATGRDSKGRKQYRYHADWKAARSISKFAHILAFAEVLPQIRAQVRYDLHRATLCREKILATVVQLLEETLIRIGNGEYARENKSYGLTTLENEHVWTDGATIHFHFIGKSGKEHRIQITDKTIAPIVHRCRALPGKRVFEYAVSDGHYRPIEAEDVNAYLHAIADSPFTAKDYRTWCGTVLAAQFLAECAAPKTEREAGRMINQAFRHVAEKLGNTAAVCRSYYVHPKVVDAFRQGTLRPASHVRAHAGWSAWESVVVSLLRGA